MKVITDEATWECACPQHPEDHRPTIGRAWCFACSEWCYPGALCVRGEAVVLRAQLADHHADVWRHCAVCGAELEGDRHAEQP